MFETYLEDEDGKLTFQFEDGKVFAHAIAKKWNKSIYLKFQDVWYVAKEELREVGYDTIYVLIPADDKKLFKFETMFGFKLVGKKDNVLLMECSTEN
jgi:hypothetical protein